MDKPNSKLWTSSPTTAGLKIRRVNFIFIRDDWRALPCTPATTQNLVATSSGEAEFYALAKSSRELMVQCQATCASGRHRVEWNGLATRSGQCATSSDRGSAGAGSGGPTRAGHRVSARVRNPPADIATSARAEQVARKREDVRGQRRGSQRSETGACDLAVATKTTGRHYRGRLRNDRLRTS